MQRRYKTGWSRLVSSTSSKSESNWLLLKEEWEVKRKESSQSWFCLQTKWNNKWVVPLTQYHSDLYHFLSFHCNDTFLSKYSFILYELISKIGFTIGLLATLLDVNCSRPTQFHQLEFCIELFSTPSELWDKQMKGGKASKSCSCQEKCLKSWVELRWASFVTQLESLFLM